MKKIFEDKLNLGVIFGGMSTENEVSCMSASSILKSLNVNKYNITPIYINRYGEWFKLKNVKINEDFNIETEKKESIQDVMGFLKNFDMIFPILHGLYGEDGTIQGLLELIKVPYVGCGVLASSVGMDKIYTKIIFDKVGLNQAKYIYIRKFKDKYMYIDDNFNFKLFELDDVIDIAISKIKFPMFIKPSNSGSSVGINKAHNNEELRNAIIEASNYDKKIIVEEEILGKEVECAVLGNEEVIISCVGEIKSAGEFYSYDAKYNNKESKTVIPAEISNEKSMEVQGLAKKAFRAIDGKGLSRVDFFIEDKTKKVYINEINTLPGFTNISMYPKLFSSIGISYEELLDRLIEISK